MSKASVDKACISTFPPIDLSGEPDWKPFNPQVKAESPLRFVSGEPDSNRFRVRYYHDGDELLKGRVWFGPETEGPPGHAHGGAIAAVMDEVLGLTGGAAGQPVLVGKLSVTFRAKLPLLSVVTAEGRIISVEGRKVMVQGRIYCGETVYAEGDCICITVQKSRNN